MSTFGHKFLYKNKITTTSQITTAGTGLSDTDANKLRLFDRNEEVQYSSIGSTTGTRTITIAITAAITRIFVQNINWDTFTIKYDTTTTFSTPITFTGNTQTSLYFEFNSVTPGTNVTVSVSATMTAGDTIKCGQLYIGTEILEVPSTIGGNYKINPYTSQKILELSDGTSYKNYIRSIRNYSLQLMGLSTTDRTNLKTVFDTNRREAVVFIPRAATSTDVWDGIGGHVNWVNPPDFDNWTLDVQANGFDANVQLVQAGGLG